MEPSSPLNLASSSPTEKPGQALSRVLETLEPPIRPLFLQHLEAKARREQNLEYLRALKEYRESQACLPMLRKI